MVGVFSIFFLSAVIVTSNYDLYYIARALVDPSHEVYYLVDETETDPWKFQPQDVHIRILNRADVFIHNGTYEKKWLDEMIWKARNPKIVEGKEGHINISKYLSLKDSSNCFMLNKENIRRISVILSGFFRKLSPDFSEEFYEKRLSDFLAQVDNFFVEFSTTVSQYILGPFAIYSPCMIYLTDELKINYDFMVKKHDSERFTYRLARDASEVMKRMKVGLLISSFDIEKDAEVGFMSAETPILKIPAHLGRRFPDFKSIINGIEFVGDIEKFKKFYQEAMIKGAQDEKRKVQPTFTTGEIKGPELKVPEEKPPLEVQKYGYITSKYTSVVLRDNPSPVAAQAGKINGGERVLILDRQNEWVKVTDGKSIGWLRISVITFEQ